MGNFEDKWRGKVGVAMEVSVKNMGGVSGNG